MAELIITITAEDIKDFKMWNILGMAFYSNHCLTVTNTDGVQYSGKWRLENGNVMYSAGFLGDTFENATSYKNLNQKMFNLIASAIAEKELLNYSSF